MIRVAQDLVKYRELMFTLSWKNIVVRYKQAYLGLAWTMLKPLMLMLIFTLVRSFVGIETGDIPYPILTFAALMPWVFFQEATSESINSVVSNAMLIRKIYFPREILPLTAVITKLVELGINFFILAGLMIYYQMVPTVYALWVPFIIFYTVIVSLCISLTGAAMNVYYRDITSALPVLLSLLMYASPVIYPLSLVKKTLLVNHAAGEWSNILYTVYTLNPLAGIIDAFQRTLLQGKPPDFAVLWPGMLLMGIILPISYLIFKRAEAYFADVI
ncbi:MAG: ABC transporter permease [Deltaproteobacteria bacterium]|nr:ABC transporter permease [Deltaproteobacteria bacterium]